VNLKEISMSNEKRMWVPEIVYEEYEGSGLTDGLPFITIPKDKEMPGVLFFLGTQETGEFEPDENGEPQPIVEVEVYQFACMKYLEDALSDEDYDKVRLAMGLETKMSARKKGLSTSADMVNNIAEKSKK
tara:strand:- start:221 stop:610 length:390 start_codon:yes stop_codon:yes gene_type:complete